MANKIIGMPDLDVKFKHLGSTAISRGEKGQAILIVKDEEIGESIITLPSFSSFDDEIQATFSKENVAYIKDVLQERPKELIVVRVNEGVDLEEDEGFNLSTITDALTFLKTKADKNCWISIADITKEESEELATFVDECNKFDKKRFKAVVYKHDADSMHVVNFTTETAKMKDEDAYREGVTLIPMVLGAVAGQSLNSSIVGRKFDRIDFVIEPEDKDKAVDSGEFFFYNDEGVVRVARGVNSLTTIEKEMTNDMKFILVVEVMDLIYSDIHKAWSDTYKGLFKNNLDNQMLLVSALNSYYRALSSELLLDSNFDNRVTIDIEKQRLANIPIYGHDEVSSWDDTRVLEMSVGTNVYLKSHIKISNAMEDLYMDIFI